MEESVHQTCLELLHQRNYEIISDDEEGIHGTRKKNDIYVFFTAQKLNKNCLKEYIDVLQNKGLDHCIVIYRGGITSDAKKNILDLKDFSIELFSENELRFNITKHRLVPKHTALSPKESKELKDAYGTKFPELKMTDPVVRFYGFTRGSVIKIDRHDGTICYRIVK